jgi:hypothetical protein
LYFTSSNIEIYGMHTIIPVCFSSLQAATLRSMACTP